MIRLHASRLLVVPALLMMTVGTASAGVTPSKDVHELPFFIHSDLLDPGMGMDLAFFQNLIDQAIADSQALLQGTQGPFDSPCCTEIVAEGTPGATLIEFNGTDAGRAESALNVVNFDADQPDLQSIVGSGSGVFLVDSLSNCAGVADAIGCGTQAPCTGNPNDDPNLITVVTIEAIEAGALGQTLAHERGHNSCLVHGATTNQCQLMRPAAGGGCLTTAECNNYRNGRTTTGGPCSCHADASSIVSDEMLCTEGSVSGMCSGGLCNDTASETFTRLVASGDPNLVMYDDASLGNAVYDAQMTISGASGNWRDEGAWDGGDEPEGLAYSPGRDRLYAVRPTAGDDELLELDPADGSVIRRQTIAGRQEIIALAWDPRGPGVADDRLFGLDTDPQQGADFETLIEIDPDNGSSSSFGLLSADPGFIITTPGGFSGLAYDPTNDQLYTSSFAGLFLIDYANCGSLCAMTMLIDPVSISPEDPQGLTLAKIGTGLAYSHVTGNLYQTGNQVGVTIVSGPPAVGTFRTTQYTVILGGTTRAGIPNVADFVDTLETIGLDGMTTGALAALPAPEPTNAALAAAAIATVLALRARRRR